MSTPTIGFYGLNSSGSGGGASISTPSGNTQATGSAFIVTFDGYAATSGVTVTDTVNGVSTGNIYTVIANLTNPNITSVFSVYLCKNGSGGNNHVFTAALAGQAFNLIEVIEVKNVIPGTPLDQYISAYSSTVGATGSNPVTTTAINEIVIALGHDTWGSSFDETPGTGFTLIEASTAVDYSSAYAYANNIGTYDPKWTNPYSSAYGGRFSMVTLSLKGLATVNITVPPVTPNITYNQANSTYTHNVAGFVVSVPAVFLH